MLFGTCEEKCALWEPTGHRMRQPPPEGCSALSIPTEFERPFTFRPIVAHILLRVRGTPDVLRAGIHGYEREKRDDGSHVRWRKTRPLRSLPF